MLLTAFLVLFRSAVRKVRVSVSAADIGPSNEKRTKNVRDDGIDDRKLSRLVLTNSTENAIVLKLATAFMVVFMGHSGSTGYINELKRHPQIQVGRLKPIHHGIYQCNTVLAVERVRDLIKHALVQGKTPGFKFRPFHIPNPPPLGSSLHPSFTCEFFALSSTASTVSLNVTTRVRYHTNPRPFSM